VYGSHGVAHRHLPQRTAPPPQGGRQVGGATRRHGNDAHSQVALTVRQTRAVTRIGDGRAALSAESAPPRISSNRRHSSNSPTRTSPESPHQTTTGTGRHERTSRDTRDQRTVQDRRSGNVGRKCGGSAVAISGRTKLHRCRQRRNRWADCHPLHRSRRHPPGRCMPPSGERDRRTAVPRHTRKLLAPRLYTAQLITAASALVGVKTRTETRRIDSDATQQNNQSLSTKHRINCTSNPNQKQ
jgi:hypothetical protein